MRSFRKIQEIRAVKLSTKNINEQAVYISRIQSKTLKKSIDRVVRNFTIDIYKIISELQHNADIIKNQKINSL